MTDRCLYALVAQATGESVLEISRRGFHDAMPLDVRFDPEPGRSRPAHPRRSHPRPATLGGRPAPAAPPAVVPTLPPSGCPEVVDFRALGIDWDDLPGSRGAAGNTRAISGGCRATRRRGGAA
jgi:hypothetical protein